MLLEIGHISDTRGHLSAELEIVSVLRGNVYA